MQTFLPFDTFEASAFCLDRQRLGKQRVEAWMLLEILFGKKSGWAKHPAVKMWRGYELALARYGLVCCATWTARGYKDNMQVRFHDAIKRIKDPWFNDPHWLGDLDFHRSHQANLVRKNPAYYEPIFPGIEPQKGYIWPEGRGEARV